MRNIIFINKKHLLENIHQIKKSYPKKKILAVIKANAYGCGLIQCAKILSPYVHYFLVATLKEGITLREIHIKNPIIILEYLENQEQLLSKYHLELMIYTFHQLHQYHHLPLHLKFDTGLNRLGLTKDDLIDFDLSNKNIQSICSHIANQERYDSQKAQLKEIYQQYFQNQNIFIHLDSSAYLSLDDFTSAIRIGMGLYSSSQDVLTLIAYICRVKKIEKGDLVGYHLQESIKEDGYLLTISFGYADGWHIKRKTRAFIDNVFIHQVGETCMDYMMFYIPFYPQGKYVQLISKNNPLDQLEHLYNESRYTILASLNQRIKRKIK